MDTRNKNTRGNYNLEQKSLQKQHNYFVLPLSVCPDTTFYPGNGLLPSRAAPESFSHNPIDIDSYLKGIGSVNLVQPLAEVIPQYKHVSTLDLYATPELILPKPMKVAPYQRQRFID